MIYQRRPRMICSLLSTINEGDTLTTTTPIDLADSIAKFRLIYTYNTYINTFLLKTFRGFFTLMALGSIAPG
jgi:hypothetical protein